jgi:hypothetical protein
MRTRHEAICTFPSAACLNGPCRRVVFAWQNRELIQLNLELRQALAEAKGEKAEQLELQIAALDGNASAQQARHGHSVGPGEIGSPKFTSTWKVMRAAASSPATATQTPLYSSSSRMDSPLIAPNVHPSSRS